MKNNETLYYAYDWYWFKTGFMSAYKDNYYTFEENWRDINSPYDDILKNIKQGMVPQSFVFRDILEKQPVMSWNEALNYVNNVPLIIPMYVIMAGLNGYDNGALITRGNNNFTYYNFNNITNGSRWYMVLTNYDLWAPDPADDNRRTQAEYLLSKWNRNIDTNPLTIGANLMALMSTWYIQNEETLYINIMSPVNHILLTYSVPEMAPLGSKGIYA